jgi:Co/Zn/Cd efflux system component
MKDCCEGKSEALACLRTRQGRVLKAVLAINAGMFVVEAAAGLVGRSTSLLADSLDMFGDAAVYGVSLYALDRGTAWRARASLLKGGLMAAFGLGVLGEAAWKALGHGHPEASTMGVVGALALLANTVCLLLLLRHRQDDINMRSTWICSRNDILANLGVLGAAWVVARAGSMWPDILVGVGIALLNLTSSVSILREARQELQRSTTPPPVPAPEPRLAAAHGLVTLSRKPLTKSPST